MKNLLSCLLILFFINPALAKEWEIDKNTSEIGFSGKHVGKRFKGTFELFSGKIIFDAKNLEKSYAKVTIDLESAKTGDATYDKTLKGKDWFYVKKYPKAFFETTKIIQKGHNSYQINGHLTIKGIKKTHSFIANIGSGYDRAIFQGLTKIKRTDYKIGESSDPSGDWVSLDISVRIKIEARAKL